MPRRLLILGAGSHARVVADLAAECGWTVVGFTDPSRCGPGVVGQDDKVAELARAERIDAALVGVGNTALDRRVELFQLVKTLGVVLPTLLHPRAAVSRSCRLGEGSIVLAGTVLGADVRIGDNVVVYSGAVVEHDCRIDDHAYLSPGVVLSGAVSVATRAFLGAGAIVLPGRTIGHAATVAAGSVVTRDVPAGTTVVGAPARGAYEQV